jgi:broad specificity phosphatase PhoE
MRTVWLIRHTESVSNAGLPSQHPRTIELTARGHAQAQALAAAFEQPPDLIVSSPYDRTKATAAPTCARFPHVPHVEWPVQEFTFLAPARYAGTTLAQRMPAARAYWERADPAALDGPGSESLLDMFGRVVALLARLEAAPQRFVAVFSHGEFLRALLWYLLACPAEIGPAEMRRFRHFLDAVPMSNGEIVPLVILPSGEKLIGVPRTDHLASIPADRTAPTHADSTM